MLKGVCYTAACPSSLWNLRELGVKHILPPKDYIKRYKFSKTIIAIRFTLL